MPVEYYDLKSLLCVRAIGTRYNANGEVVAVVKSTMDNINFTYSVPWDEFIAENANQRRFIEVTP
jgi:hypothetical protein